MKSLILLLAIGSFYQAEAANGGCKQSEYRAAIKKGKRLVKTISPRAKYVRVDTEFFPRYGCQKTLVYNYGPGLEHFYLDFD